MDIKQIEDIKAVVEYNNKAALTRFILSPSWVIGSFAGVAVETVKRLMNNKSLNYYQETDSKFNNKLHTNVAAAYCGVAEMGISTLFAQTSAAGAFSFVTGVYAVSGVVCDLLGVGTDKCAGALRAGYKQGRLGIYIKQADLECAQQQPNTTPQP